MQIDLISDPDLIEAHRLSKPLFSVMCQSRLQDTILADLPDELNGERQSFAGSGWMGMTLKTGRFRAFGEPAHD